MSTVTINHCAVPNGRKDDDGKPIGWLPVVWENGWLCASTWATHGYDQEVAAELALQQANEVAARFVGDWDIRIMEGSCPTKTMHGDEIRES